LIEEVLQQTTTVTVTASQLDFKGETAFWLGIFATCLSVALGLHQLWLALRERSKSRVRRLEPVLREIYSLLHDKGMNFGVPQAVTALEKEIYNRGLRFDLHKEAPGLFNLPELLQGEEHKLREDIESNWTPSPIWPTLSDFFQKRGIKYSTEDDRILDYGTDNWNQYVMNDKERAGRILYLLGWIDVELKMFFKSLA
jgi:hypothetical protein